MVTLSLKAKICSGLNFAIVTYAGFRNRIFNIQRSRLAADMERTQLQQSGAKQKAPFGAGAFPRGDA